MIEKLYNNFCSSGYSEKELFAELKELSDITSVAEITPYNLCVCSVVDSVTNGWKVIKFYPEYMNLKTIMGGKYLESNTSYVYYDELHSMGLPNDLIYEIEQLTYYFEYYDSDNNIQIIVPSSILQTQILALKGCGKCKKDFDPLNQMWLAHNLEDMEDFCVVQRKVGNVIKAYSAFKKGHPNTRQDEQMKSALEQVREFHPDTVVNYYLLTSLKNYVELIMPDLQKQIITSQKKHTIAPAFVYTNNNIGEKSASLRSALFIDERSITISELINITDKDARVKMVKALYKVLTIMTQIENTSSELVNKKQNVERFLDKLNFNRKVGASYRELYNTHISQFEEQCSKTEVLLEILTIPSVLNSIYNEVEKKRMPQYISDILSNLIGNIFEEINFDEECY